MALNILTAASSLFFLQVLRNEVCQATTPRLYLHSKPHEAILTRLCLLQYDAVHAELRVHPWICGAASARPPGKRTVILLDSAHFPFPLLLRRQEEDDGSPSPVEIRLSDVAAINYSSGTTRKTKAVAQSHRLLIASALHVHSAPPRAPGGPLWSRCSACPCSTRTASACCCAGS